MGKKDKHFDMRLSPLEAIALDQLAKRRGLTKSEYLRRFLHQEAKKKGIPV